MLHYDKIDFSEGMDVNKTSKSNKCDIRHYWYSTRCHDVLMMSMNLSDIAILDIYGVDYCCIISRISNSEAINLMQNVDLTEKSRIL